MNMAKYKLLLMLVLLTLPLAFALDLTSDLLFWQNYTYNNPTFNNHSLLDSSGWTSDSGIGHWGLTTGGLDSWGSNDGLVYGGMIINSSGAHFDGVDDYILVDDNGDRFGKTICNNGCTFCVDAKLNRTGAYNEGSFIARFDAAGDDRFSFWKGR